MAGAATLLFGRDREVAAVEEFVATVVDGFAALLIEGEAGIGKTAVWEAAVASARVRDYRVLGAHPAEVEADLSLVGLADGSRELALLVRQPREEWLRRDVAPSGV